ncbi:hypothetical protein BD289DRAFT_427052 [Coniella lustricola]|uniref:MOZ protein represents a chromatin-associated acetyltransferase n=1 Tax=Coniella lustricola TaxID=2025994 RepID=A0A2T3AFS2_9PEZI|nr:hypothetical protein BD289DRAFT_427052 [Coniella lustricola]
MSTQRLTFLYPTLFRSTARRCRSVPASPSSPSSASSLIPGRHSAHLQRQQQHATLSTSTASSKASFAPRVGKGVEPKPLGDVQPAPALESHMQQQGTDGGVISLPPPDSARESTPEQRKDAAKALDPASDSLKKMLSSPGVSASEKRRRKKEQLETEAEAQNSKDDSSSSSSKTPTADGEASTGQDGATQSSKKRRATGPMDAVLHIEPPENTPLEEKPPHLSPAPYVHHFDSYSLVKQLEQDGYTQAQAITAMKAVRTLLAQNLDVAQGGLISKSDVENETYLFQAACAELSTEVMNNRRIADEELRRQRTVLQHEVDNLTQAMSQELHTLNDNVRGMFNDRKMAVREEQKKAEGAIQQIAYKISVTLNSDSRSQIEAVRWVVTRRAVAGIVFMVTLSLGILRYSSYVSHESQREALKQREEKEVVRKSAGKIDVAQAHDAAEILAAN